MPVSIKKIDGKYRVSTPSAVHAKGTTKKKAEAQGRLLNAVDHGWKPTGKKATRESVEQIKAMIAEGGHKAGCKCAFCTNYKGKGFGKKKDENKPEPEEPKETPMSEGRDDIGALPISRQAKSYARRGGLASMKRQPKDYINMVAADTNQQGKKAGFKNFDAAEKPSGGAVGASGGLTHKKGESLAQEVVDTMLNG